MPRSVKDCDEDVESKIGRRTRGSIANLVTDSPVRRSNRNKMSTKQSSSSLDELITETSTHNLRGGTRDSITLDTSCSEAQPKKMTRRSLAAALASETSKADTRPKRLTRAGSELASTPLRSTRKTRASSMDPELTPKESIEETPSKINTPIKVKRRASILPSQSTLVEEEEKIPVVELEKMLIEVDETPAELIATNETTPNNLESQQNKSFEKIENTDKIQEEKDLNSAEGLVDDSSQNNRTEISEAFKNDANSLSDKMNTPKKDENPAVVLTKDVSTESHDIPEADLPDKEKESKIRSLSNTPVMSKKKSVTESSILKSKEKKKKADVQDVEDNDDDVSNIKELFQDIPADKWKQKSKNINTETENISIDSAATVKLETDSETECDLLLVDKQAWLAAEKLKAIKNKEKFDYDSDDTIILKTELDYLNDKFNNKNNKEMKSKDTVQDKDTNSEIKENTEKSNISSKQLSKEVQDVLEEVEETSNKSINKTITDKNDMNISSHSSSKKERSRRSRSSCNVSKSELTKSLDKQLEKEEEEEEEDKKKEQEEKNKKTEEEKEKEEYDKEISLTQKVSENVEMSAMVDVNKVEVNPSQSKLKRSSLDKKQNKSRSLNSSLNSSINKTNKSKSKSEKRNRLNISSSEEEENDDNSECDKNELTQLQLGSGKKRINPNYSTMVHIGSDSSDSCDESMDSNKRNNTPRIPRFLFKNKDNNEQNEEDNESDDGSDGVEGKFSDISIDSDIKAEYNLDGKTRKFSDDDIPGDECRASESEFSDPDDNGSDLTDFVVNDDEVEEEEEEEEGEEEEEEGGEGEEEEGEEEEEEEEEEGEGEEEGEEEKEEEEEVEIEMEVEEQEENKENEKENTKLTENMNRTKEIDSRNTTISCEEKGNEIDDEKTNKGSSNKKMNISDLKSEKRRISKEKISTQLNFSESDEDKIVSDAISELNSSTSGKKQKQKLSENSEATQESQNDTTFTKKNKEPNISLTCSTPKIDVLSKQKLKHNTSKGENDRKSTDKVLTNEEQEKVHTQDLSADNSETNTSTMSNSKTTKKKCSIKHSSTENFIELFKDQTLSKMLLSKNRLNKSLSQSNDTPKTKFLRKEKLHDSFPNIKLEDKKNVSKTTDINDHNKNAREEDENSETITADVTEQLESSWSASTKSRRSTEMIDLNDQTELKNKENKESIKLKKYTGSDNENENFESELKNDDKKKATKSKKNKKKKNAKKELVTANIDTTPMAKKNMDKDEETEIVCSNNESKNKNKKKKNKYKKNIEIQDKNNEQLMTTAEVDNIPNKKTTKITSELPTLQVKEKSKKVLRKNTIKSSDSEESGKRPSSTEFIKSKHEALEAAKLAIENIKADRGKKKNNQKDQSQRIQQQEKEVKVKKSDQIMTKRSTQGIKRLPADVIENLSDVPTNPFKKQKLIDKSMQQMTKSHTSMTKSGFKERTKNNQKDQSQRIQQQEKEVKVKKPDQIMSKISTRGIKRLPADVTENLSDVPTNPFKKQKLIDKSVQQMTKSHKSMTKSGFLVSYVTKKRGASSNSGSTTEFNVTNLQKAKKRLTVVSPTTNIFKSRMFNRNSRYPTSSYIMYLQKQQAANKDQHFTIQQ